MIRLPEIKTAEFSTYGNFAKCHQAHFRVSRVGLGTRLGRRGLRERVVIKVVTLPLTPLLVRAATGVKKS